LMTRMHDPVVVVVIHMEALEEWIRIFCLKCLCVNNNRVVEVAEGVGCILDRTRGALLLSPAGPDDLICWFRGTTGVMMANIWCKLIASCFDL
jgi:hypothetical protein